MAEIEKINVNKQQIQLLSQELGNSATIGMSQKAISEQLVIMPERELNSTSWSFKIKLKKDDKYYVKCISGFTSKLNIGNTIGSYINYYWTEYTVPETGYPYFYFGNVDEPPAEPVILLTKENPIYLLNKIIDDYDVIINSYIVNKTYSAYKSNNTSWIFKELYLNEGQTYYIKLLEGDGNNVSLNISSIATSFKMKTNQFVEYVSPASGNPYFYMGAGNLHDVPTIEVICDTNIPFQISEIENQISLGTVYEGIESEYHNSWWFDFNMTEGQSYYVKHISGSISSLNIGSSIGTQLVNNQWVEYVAPESGHPYIYLGVGNLGERSVIKIAPIESVFVPFEKKIEQRGTVTTINVSRDGTSKTGRTIHFSGLTAIADAINSITDASETNRYIIHIEGEFHFTDPLTLTMYGGNEYSVIFKKQYVDIEGDGPDKSIIFVDFPANATFHDGKVYNDYQPIYFYNSGGYIRNMKIVGKNCRYTFHIEAGAGANDQVIDIDNCTLISYGAPDYASNGGMSCFGTGIASGQIWNIRNCNIINYSNSATFAMHTPLVIFAKPPMVNFENCVFKGNFYFGNYQVENVTYIKLIGCTYAGGEPVRLNYSYYNNRSFAVHGDYTTVLFSGNTFKMIYYTSNLNYDKGKGCVLRITSKSTGASSKVRFDHTSSAFSSIIGDSSYTGNTQTVYRWNTQYGYVYRDGGKDLNGQCFGTLDIDEYSSANKTLGTLLGNCSTNNKQLTINIDNVNYTVLFNEDYTEKSNQYVLDKINAVISSVGTADEFCPAYLYYPYINGLCEVASVDDEPILKGMGVVFTSNGMRRATNTDTYFDGVCIDNTSKGQIGRIVTTGYLWTDSSYYSILKTGTEFTQGQTFGIDSEMPGRFKISNTQSFIRYKDGNIAELLTK